MVPSPRRTPALEAERTPSIAAHATRSDEDLALAARAGETSAFEALVARFEGSLYSFLRVRTGNAAEAEELAQDAFLRAWERLARYDPRWRFSTWLFTLARNLAVSRARSHKMRAVGEEELASVSAGADPALIAAERDEHANVWGIATRVLSPEQRSALWLRYGEDLSIEEVASVLRKNRVTVRVLLFRAREALAAHLERSTGGIPRRSVSMNPGLLV